VFNTAFGERTTLNMLTDYLQEFLGAHDPQIKELEILHGPNRLGDIPHSLASFDKAKQLLGYYPKFSIKEGLRVACEWYWRQETKD